MPVSGADKWRQSHREILSEIDARNVILWRNHVRSVTKITVAEYGHPKSINGCPSHQNQGNSIQGNSTTESVR
jgi:hypothetical protein